MGAAVGAGSCNKAADPAAQPGNYKEGRAAVCWGFPYSCKAEHSPDYSGFRLDNWNKDTLQSCAF